MVVRVERCEMSLVALVQERQEATEAAEAEKVLSYPSAMVCLFAWLASG